MTTIVAAFLLFILIQSQTNGEPLLFLPQHMLPSAGTTFTLTYDLIMATLRIPSIYSLQAVLAPDLTTVIGYRNWLQSDYGASYRVSLTNGSYFQANVDLNTRECINVLVETVNCAGWSSVKMQTYENLCNIHPINTQFISQRTLMANLSMTDPKYPESITDTTISPGFLGQISLLYQFTSKTEQTAFPDIKCYF
ncbi:unnamed protein product [Rotaria magnacalcarata]|uniref:Uncharacterized protein n=1 Tax=Rotaria magnacalcarata TaxID=392030 RepID=A0A816Q0R5_9BILA|nr:unnamed protein product [Rotaria magnacalcarata]CAF3923429.1 unnamed protein product [Rotaria magnacalcarata]